MDAKRIDLPDRDTMEPQVGLFYIMQGELRERLKAAVAELTPAQLAWIPEKGGNSIGALLLHIAEAELFWIQYVCAGQELSAEQKEEFRTELFGELADAPPLEEHPAEWFTEKLNVTRRITEGFYARLTDLSLNELKQYTGDKGEMYEFTVRWVLYHVLEHEAGHRAQILMLRGMLQARDIA